MDASEPSLARGENWGREFPLLRPPDQADLTAIRQLAASLPQATPAERAEAAAKAGLLKDLAASFWPAVARDVESWSRRRVGNLAEVVERFDEIAEALGYEPHERGSQGDEGDPKRLETSPAGAGPELRLKDSRIDRCNLSSASVNWPIRLEHCLWAGPAVFVGVGFRAPASFLGSTFLSDAHFFAATFDAQAFFGGADFGGPADFRGAGFAAEVSFFGANFRESLELRFATLAPSSELNIQELRFKGSTALGGGLHLHLQQLRTGRWPKFTGRIAGENSPDRHDLAAACEQYGELEANFAAQGSPHASAARDWCHYRYMDLARRAHCPRWSPMRLWNWLFLKWCFGYGIYTKRILLTGLLVLALFALLFFTNGLGLSPDQWAVTNNDTPPVDIASTGPWYFRLGNALYFSAVTFSTIGYGDFHPQHWAKLAGGIEGLLGVFIMAVFTVSFSRKILR